MEKENLPIDEMPEKAHKKIHNISFTFTALMIGVVLFFISQTLFLLFIVDDEEKSAIFGNEKSAAEVTPDKDLGHDYCGTFYIWLTVENNYGSAENFLSAEKATDLAVNKPLTIAELAVYILMFVCITLAFRKANKRRFFGQNGWRLIMTAGVALLIKGIWTVIIRIYLLNAEQPYVAGIFENRRYYCQIYQTFGIPAILIMTALITRQHSLNVQKKDTSGNAKVLKIFSVLIGAAASVFMLTRLTVRIYEIINYKSHDAMLPFYFDLLTLPRELADSPETYRDLLIFRLIKDLPVFIASAVTVILMIMIMLSSARNEINTRKNMKRFNISMLVLFISSLIFNILGLHEVDIFNDHFSGVYGYVVYTIGLRALCDPVLYVIFLWFVRSFVSISGKEEQ